MTRIDTHCHFIPNLDDGCQNLEDSLTCLRLMADNGYSKIFCTPHCGSIDFTDLTPPEVAERVRTLQGHVDLAGIPIQLKPGGELRLSPHFEKGLPADAIPTFGHQGKYVLVDLWEHDWPAWATAAVEWLQSKGLIVIIAHPERMPVLRQNPEFISQIASLGVLFQGNLGPIGGGDSADIVSLARRYLLENRYFMVGTDGHRPNHMAHRINGLKIIEQLTTSQTLQTLTATHPARLWN